MTPLHEAARSWAKAGFFVFPCYAGSKKPACPNGFKDATNDLAKIDEWWTTDGNYNIGCAPDASGCFVVDLDPPLGVENWKRLERENQTPDTLTIKTPRGGFHLWFAGRNRSGVNILGPKIDTRGVGGYVLVPPSHVVDPAKGIDGSYTDYNDADIQPIPAWIVAKMESTHVKQETSNVELDLPNNIDRARRVLASYVERGDTAIEGKGGDDRTYRLCCEVLNLGVSPVRAFELINEIWNPHCQPPWEADELQVKIDNAASYCQNAEGCFANPSGDDLFGEYVTAQADADPEPVGNNDTKSRFHFRDQDEQETAEEPRWLIPNVLPEEGLVMMFGPPESFKSFLALDIAMSLSAAVPVLGYTPTAPIETAYIAGEGSRGIERKRAPAWRLAHDIQGKVPMFTINEVPWASQPDQVKDFIKTARREGRKPKLVIIDTLSYFMSGLNENDAKDAVLALQAANMIRRELHCTVMIIHHTGKDKDRGARGSSNFRGWCDTMLEVTAENRVKAVVMRIDKQKDAEKLDTPFHFAGRLVGPSLVFFPATVEEYRGMMESADAAAPKAVGAALHRLHAYGDANAITTAILAAELASVSGQDPVLLEKLLNRQSKPGKPLEAYRVPSGMWCLPEEASPNA